MAEREGGPRQPQDAAEMQRQMLEELARLRVGDVLLQVAFTLTSIASARLGIVPETHELRDLAEAKLAIDTLGSLMPVVGGALDPAEVTELRQALAGLQLAYAQIAREAGQAAGAGARGGPPSGGGAGEGGAPRPGGGEGGQGGAGQGGEGGQPPRRPDQPPRRPVEPDRPRIWTPRGEV
jgi:hypothetical protein